MAVVRLKRNCSEEPLDVLLLASKRRKTEEGDTPITSLFKFAATVNNQEDSSLQFAHSSKTEAEKLIKKPSRLDAILEKARKDCRSVSKKSRYKVVNCYRALDVAELTEESNDSSEKKGLTVLDVESTNTDNAETDLFDEITKTKPDYVYDIYYAESADLIDLQLEHIYSVHPMEAELVYDSYRNNDDSDENADDDDDSNDENNWRNDYPDEEDVDSDDGIWGNCGNDDDDSESDEGGGNLVSKLQRFNIEDGEELSTEDELYSGDLSPSDVHNFGKSYAKYKANLNRNLYDSSCSVDDDEDS